MPTEKIRVAVLYGGRSGEYEVSLVSAASVIRNLDKSRYEIIPIAIDKAGRWLLHDLAMIDQTAKSLPVNQDALSVVLPPFPAEQGTELVGLGSGGSGGSGKQLKNARIDVVFPVMHGPLCEDGTIQGLLELADVAYVGCGVLASAVGMDKDVAKRLAQLAGITVVPWITLRRGSYESTAEAVHKEIAERLGFPCFVKPANMGSSVGVVKVKTAAELSSAIEAALSYDTKVLVEKAINCREIEVAVLEDIQAGNPPMVSIAGEVIPAHEFYSYEAKYLDENGAALKLPADLTSEQLQTVRKMAGDAFTALEGEGLARCDFLLDKDTGTMYFNEVNTMPGFTSISMYPKLMDASGVPYPELLAHLIELAIRRHRRKTKLKRDYSAER